MSSWEYRVVKVAYPEYGEAEDSSLVYEYGIHEVYYDENDKPISRTVNPVPAFGDSVEDLRVVLEQMMAALEQPVLTDQGDELVEEKMS